VSLRWFERRIDPLADGPLSPDGQIVRPPERLWPFYWHFVRQVWPWVLVTMAVGLCASLIEVSLFAFMAEIVDLVRTAETPEAFLAEHGLTLLLMAFVALILRPLFFALHALAVNQVLVPNLTNLVRWQTHRYVLRQSMSFFQNDFAGRIANKIIQTGPALRESVVQVTDALWFVAIYATSALVLFADNDLRLTIPLLLWIAGFIGLLSYFVPRIRDRAAIMSEARSMLTGRIVDSYTNINTVKLFAPADPRFGQREDDYAREGLADHTGKFRAQQRLITGLEATVWTLNGVLVVGTGGLAVWLWSVGEITVGAIALAIGLVIRINNMSGWIMWVVTGIFENIGTVQEGMETISRVYDVTDRPDARPLVVTKGAISFDSIRFHYGKAGGIIERLSLDIAPGEKVGLVGRSGAGKSTLVNLLLRFYDLEGGRILIDGQDIAQVTQDSLRAHIGMVTQDTSLLHRSVLDNILYGRPQASRDDALAAADAAQAMAFIPDLQDLHGRRGFEAHVGERGVKLSGGQRQRIAIARVLLKNAPILVLDEATSALDSEVEAAIQEQLSNLMAGKTVIAIAHRLSTIAAMDRLVVMDKGDIVEQGSHRLLRAALRGGIYAELWRRQSGGFLATSAA